MFSFFKCLPEFVAMVNNFVASGYAYIRKGRCEGCQEYSWGFNRKGGGEVKKDEFSKFLATKRSFDNKSRELFCSFVGLCLPKEPGPE